MPELFRIENPLSDQSLWYDTAGNLRPIIHRLTDAKARDMPMGFDPDFGAEGLRWYSACTSIEALSCVVSHRDIIELERMGYDLWRFEVDRFRTNDWHALFAREDVRGKTKVNMGLLKRSLRTQQTMECYGYE